MSKQLIIFSDLDGTLLNHDDYSFEKAMPSLERIKDLSIPLVLCTSKTLPEVEAVQMETGIRGPFIVENGGGIFFPEGFESMAADKTAVFHGHPCISLGASYGEIRSFIRRLNKRFSLRGFGDMSVEEVAERTGLSLQQAAMAKTRDFTEPFIIEQEKELVALQEIAKHEQMEITRGGRFFHFTGLGSDKGEAVGTVRDIFFESWQSEIVTVGLGDSRSDFPMLRKVDIPVLIPHERGAYEEITLPGLIKAVYPGSMGWNAVMEQLIAALGFSDN
jgi:mannosyl-3-phosphoglycerate phosphatase